MGTSVAILEKHYGHTSNVASAEELKKSGNFRGDKKDGLFAVGFAKAVQTGCQLGLAKLGRGVEQSANAGLFRE